MLTAPALGGEYTGTAAFSPADLTWDRTGVFDLPVLGNASPDMTPGAPALPCVQVNVALPAGARVLEVRALDVQTSALAGRYDIAPMTRPRTVASGGAAGDPFVKDMGIYGRDSFHPGVFAEMTAQWDLAGQDFVTVTLHPLQYNPVTGEAVMARTIAYRVIYEESQAAVRETYNLSNRVHAVTLDGLKRRAVNPEAVSLPPWNGDSSGILPPADIEYVVIAPQTFRRDWEPLVEWMLIKGIPARTITLEQIYANFTGATDPEKIRNFVIDAHATWGTIYFLLGGDTSLVPFHVWDPAGNSVPSDTYYADYDDDWKVEVYVGRASVENSVAIARFVDKTLAYQRNPPQDFGDTYFFMGFDLDASTQGEKCKEYIKNYYLPAGADLVTEYDSEAGSHKGDCIALLDDGQNLINNIDHAGWDVLGAGCVWHGELFYRSDFINLANGDRQGLFYSMGCYSLAFDYEDNIGEVWTQQSGGAGLAFVGNSRYGWYAVGYSNLYSMKYDQAFFEVLCKPFGWEFYAGRALGESKNECYPGNGTDQYIFQELTLVGDPGLQLWTEEPVALDVQHLPGISAGLQDFGVKVTCNGQDLERALVCIRKESEVYRRAYTAVDGTVTFRNIDPRSSGWMTVTVTANNRLPYEGTCIVSGGSGPDLDVDLEFGSLSYFFGTDADYTIDVANFTGTTQTFSLWTNVTLPGGRLWPPSGYMDGPEIITLPAYGTAQRVYSRLIQPTFPAGTYTVNAFVGPDPGVIDEDHERVDILPP
jgi:hypothetical protein